MLVVPSSLKLNAVDVENQYTFVPFVVSTTTVSVNVGNTSTTSSIASSTFSKSERTIENVNVTEPLKLFIPVTVTFALLPISTLSL